MPSSKFHSFLQNFASRSYVHFSDKLSALGIIFQKIKTIRLKGYSLLIYLLNINFIIFNLRKF